MPKSWFNGIVFAPQPKDGVFDYPF